MPSTNVAMIAVVVTMLASCTAKEEAKPKEAPPSVDEQPTAAAGQDPTAEAAQMFETVCAVCHGMSGDGKGEGSAGLDPKPRNLTSPEWQDSVTDDYIAKIIVYGGAGVGKSPAMPANPQLTDKPEVVKALTAYIRDLAK